tara:strand:+ start:335 stop:655 length:321 start_codon:yes stop_codon:yes gene_type:complete
MKNYKTKLTEEEYAVGLSAIALMENAAMKKICHPKHAPTPIIPLTEENVRFYMLRLMEGRPLWTVKMLQSKLKVKQCMIQTWLTELKKQKKVTKENGEWKLFKEET